MHSVPLPLDLDGLPIHPGDPVELLDRPDGLEHRVTSITLHDDCGATYWMVGLDGLRRRVDPLDIRRSHA